MIKDVLWHAVPDRLRLRWPDQQTLRSLAVQLTSPLSSGLAQRHGAAAGRSGTAQRPGRSGTAQRPAQWHGAVAPRTGRAARSPARGGAGVGPGGGQLRLNRVGPRFDVIRTDRLIMRRWREADREPFAALNADPEVMRYFPAPLDRAASDAMVDRIEDLFLRQGFGLWALEVSATGEFIGFTGLNPMPGGVPGAGGMEVGWRLARGAWHQGYASEAAAAAAGVAFRRSGPGGALVHDRGRERAVASGDAAAGDDPARPFRPPEGGGRSSTPAPRRLPPAPAGSGRSAARGPRRLPPASAGSGRPASSRTGLRAGARPPGETDAPTGRATDRG